MTKFQLSKKFDGPIEHLKRREQQNKLKNYQLNKIWKIKNKNERSNIKKEKKKILKREKIF